MSSTSDRRKKRKRSHSVPEVKSFSRLEKALTTQMERTTGSASSSNVAVKQRLENTVKELWDRADQVVDNLIDVIGQHRMKFLDLKCAVRPEIWKFFKELRYDLKGQAKFKPNVLRWVLFQATAHPELLPRFVDEYYEGLTYTGPSLFKPFNIFGHSEEFEQHEKSFVVTQHKEQLLSQVRSAILLPRLIGWFLHGEFRRKDGNEAQDIAAGYAFGLKVIYDSGQRCLTREMCILGRDQSEIIPVRLRYLYRQNKTQLVGDEKGCSEENWTKQHILCEWNTLDVNKDYLILFDQMKNFTHHKGPLGDPALVRLIFGFWLPEYTQTLATHEYIGSSSIETYLVATHVEDLYRSLYGGIKHIS
jgi:hypothetical protein